MKLLFKHTLILLSMFILLLPATASALSVGQKISINSFNNKDRVSSTSTEVTVEKTGNQVFISNAPEAIEKKSQVNQTLYRDSVRGEFRFWSYHINKLGGPISFYMFVKNTNSYPINLYYYSKGDGLSTDPDNPAKAGSQAIDKFLKESSSKSKKFIVRLKPGESHFFNYANSKGKYTIAFIGDFRAENATNNQTADFLKISDIVTNDGSKNINQYANTTTIAPTNVDVEAGKDDCYRGLLEHSGRTVTVTLTLDSNNLEKWIAFGDGESLSLKDEQERLKSRWSREGRAQDASEVFTVKNGITKYQGAFWATDYTFSIDIVNKSERSKVLTLLGSAKDAHRGGTIHYKISPATKYKPSVKFDKGQAVVIDNRKKYTLDTIIPPGINSPYGLFFMAE
ncbi:hypothetical protein P4H61_16875 [Paenibacillus peoriae]|uniref:hypothetical protein n=1 Tax=Paenibacillus peoriae TaxID=59893 RepID=UPI00026C627E|nr:hypothetical protein [Paenibacillus peoriae]MEC0183162.1 hypothetical protein [Paenibacillus peoriae]